YRRRVTTAHLNVLRRNRIDANFGVVLTMALTLLVVLAPAQLEDTNLIVAAMRKNRGLDDCASNKRSTNLELVAFAHCQNLVKCDFLPNVCRYLFYLQVFAGGNAILLAAGFYDRIHGEIPWKTLSWPEKGQNKYRTVNNTRKQVRASN